MKENKHSFTYRLLKRIGIYLSPVAYGNISFLRMFIKTMRLWKNEILHKLARNSVILMPAPLNSRFIRPRLHRCRGVKVGANVFIGLEVMFDSVYPEKIQIGDGCIIANRVQLLTHNRDMTNYGPDKRLKDAGYIVKDIIIEDNVVLGIDSIVLAGVRIGNGAVIAAGSLVTRDVEPYTMVAGVPAKLLKRFDGKPVIK